MYAYAMVLNVTFVRSEGIRRGSRVWPYTVTADHRLVEADWDQIICEVNSQYQNIKIVNSPTSGHVLLLDDDVMIAGKLTRGKHICGSDFWRQDVEQVSNLSHRFPSRGNTSSEECSHFRKRLDLHDGFVRRWNESRYSSGRFS